MVLLGVEVTRRGFDLACECVEWVVLLPSSIAKRVVLISANLANHVSRIQSQLVLVAAHLVWVFELGLLVVLLVCRSGCLRGGSVLGCCLRAGDFFCLLEAAENKAKFASTPGVGMHFAP